MPRHVDLTANVQRTREELLRVTYSIDQINAVIDGYPELNNRLFMAEGEHIPWYNAVLLGREVNIYELPAGYDATNSSYRTSTLANPVIVKDFLFGSPDPDWPTGGDWALTEDHPTVVRALYDRCRDFTQHYQPLVPGWRQLLALRAENGTPLGMPTGIGWYAHYWLSEMCDAVTMRLSEERDDLEVLLYKRNSDNQSEWVWATPGGYVLKSDTNVPDKTPLQVASARRTKYWAEERDVSEHLGVPVRVKYPISSGNTLVAGLKTTPYARFVGTPNYAEEPTINEATERGSRTQRAAGYVSLSALLERNPTGGVAGKGHGENPLPIWTTHLEYVAAAADVLIDPENQYRFRMNDQQFSQVQGVVRDLQEQYPELLAA